MITSATTNPVSNHGPRREWRSLRALVLLLVAGSILGASAVPAGAAVGLREVDGAVNDQAGQAYTQAGGHPYDATVTFDLARHINAFGHPEPDAALRNMRVDLPPGLVGNPNAMPKCSGIRDLFDEENGIAGCPFNSQIGIAKVEVVINGFPATLVSSVHNIQPTPGSAASFAFAVANYPIVLNARLRSDGDYGLTIDLNNANQGLPLLGSTVTFWGVPADPSHDADRGYSAGLGGYCAATPNPACSFSAGVPQQAFLTNPTRCTVPGEGFETFLHAEFWQHPGESDDTSFVSHAAPGFPLPRDQWGSPIGTDGCDKLSFQPSISVHPDTAQPDTPTGLSVDLSFPQLGLSNPSGLAQAQLKDAVVTLPEGMTVSPSSADGLKGCSDEQLGIGTLAAAACPPESKIGTVSATTPLLAEGLSGGIYVGTQRSDDPESGRLFRIFLELRNDARGLIIKLPGQVRASKATGRIEATFSDNPPLPVSNVHLTFEGGPRAPLATPLDCGTKTVTSRLSSWSGQVATPSSSFTIACPPGLGGFAPRFTAGALDPVAGAFSPFAVRIDRSDRDQYLAGVDVRIPDGLLAKLKGVALCPEARAAAGTCGIESRVGTATVGAGPGSHPFFVKGPVSLTGPYKGAPYGLSVAVRAIAGPFDLGTVIVRQAIYVDPADAHLTVVSDPLPTIVKGVPLRLRSVNVDVDRPGFTINPTSCATKEIAASFRSTGGAQSRQVSRFQVGECRSLRFSPKLRLRLTGSKQTTDGKHPGLKALLTQPAKQANLKAVKVRLPLSLALDPKNATSDALCELAEGRKADPHCPKSSIIGSARAVTPLLARPLTGKVFFVKNVRVTKRGQSIRTLPTLLVALRGEIAINLRAETSVEHGKLVSTFRLIPDAPVTRFDLSLNGGPRGILTVTGRRGICRGRQIAGVDVDGQNGRRADQSVTFKTPCGARGASAGRPHSG